MTREPLLSRYGIGGGRSRRVGYSPALEGLRAWSILPVLLYHVAPRLDIHDETRLLTGAFIVLNVFFVLSGFLNTSSLLESLALTGRLELFAFARRRMLRFLPNLLLLVATWVLYEVFLSPRRVSDDMLFHSILSVLFFVANVPLYDLKSSQLWLGFGHLWSLAVEVHFLILWSILLACAVVCRATIRHVAYGVAAIILLIVVWRIRFWNESPDVFAIYFRTDTRIDSLFCGALLALIVHTTPIVDILCRSRFRGALVSGATVALTVLIFTLSFGKDFYLFALGGSNVIDLCVSVLVLSLVYCRRGPIALFLLERPTVRWIGRISYSLYLWHFPVYVVVAECFPELSGVELRLVKVSGAFAVAAVAYFLVERPVLRLTNVGKIPPPEKAVELRS